MKSRWLSLARHATAVAMLAAAPNAMAQVGSSMSAPDADQKLQEEASIRDSARKQELINAVVAARETASARRFSPALRDALAGKLSSVPTSSLEAFANAGGLGDIDSLVRSTDPKLLGDSAADLIFTPVTPCRIINTTVAGGPITGSTRRSFFVNGNTAGTFETQGGTAGGCGIPDTATAVAMNFVAVGPAGPGDLRAFPWAASPTVPNASVINYSNLPGLNIANGIAQPVCNAATTTCTFDLIVQADVSTSHLVVDVVGYYNKVNKAEVKSVFAARAVKNTNVDLATIFGCVNQHQITINAPVAGNVLVRGDITFRINHTTGTTSEAVGYVSTAPTVCNTGTSGNLFASVPGAAPTGLYFQSMSTSAVFPVAAGANTFYLNGLKTSGASVGIFTGALDATFIPN